jgi:hypothetical protein
MMQASKGVPESTEAQGPRRTGTVKCGSNWDTFTIVAGYVSRFGKYVRSS